jgi:transposase
MANNFPWEQFDKVTFEGGLCINKHKSGEWFYVNSIDPMPVSDPGTVKTSLGVRPVLAEGSDGNARVSFVFPAARGNLLEIYSSELDLPGPLTYLMGSMLYHCSALARIYADECTRFVETRSIKIIDGERPSWEKLPEIDMQVSHYILQQCDCPNCGKTVKATLPSDVSTGYGPRFTALIGELSGIKAMSRNDVKQLCESVLGIPIATGTIQKIVDRTSNALLPVYEHIGRIARRFWCNYIDETSWFKQNDLHWLWAMVNERVAFYRIDPHRSKEAFEKLVRDWNGILVSDSYGLYRKWVNRQTCLAHLIRKADALAERKKPDLRRFGEIVAAWLRQLVSFAKAPPDSKQWSDFYTFFLFTISLWENDKTDAGKLARQIVREVDSLWTFLDHQGVDPTNNRAERALRFGVLWRKRSLGTQSEKGNRWVERILSMRETCRLNAKPTFPFLVECITSYFRRSTPNLSWI